MGQVRIRVNPRHPGSKETPDANAAMRRFSYFFLGIVFTCAVVAALALWDSFHGFKIWDRVNEAIPRERQELRAEDLVGKWVGKESRGATYNMVRRSDGTFSEFFDFTHYNAPHPPLIVTSSGCWTLAGSRYAYYYTKSTDPSLIGRGPWIRIITTVSAAEFTYSESEGNEVRETKE
jgi:hypothetical protein